MSKIIPYFEVEGTRYEIIKTIWLTKEYNKLREQSNITNEEKEKVVEFNRLIANLKKFTEKEEACWEELCENPTDDNYRAYNMFKDIRDKAVIEYNKFIAGDDTIAKTTKQTVDILEKVAIKGIAEQYFSLNEKEAKPIWEKFVEQTGNHDVVAEWLFAMMDCLFGEEEKEDNNDFLSQLRKEKANKSIRKSFPKR